MLLILNDLWSNFVWRIGHFFFVDQDRLTIINWNCWLIGIDDWSDQVWSMINQSVQICSIIQFFRHIAWGERFHSHGIFSCSAANVFLLCATKTVNKWKHSHVAALQKKCCAANASSSSSCYKTPWQITVCFLMKYTIRSMCSYMTRVLRAFSWSLTIFGLSERIGRNSSALNRVGKCVQNACVQHHKILTHTFAAALHYSIKMHHVMNGVLLR